MPERIRLAVAGAGAFGREHLRALAKLPDVEVVGVADVNLAAAQEAAAEFNAGLPAADTIDLIGNLRPDGLIVVSPAATHVPFAIKALELGISVLVEKPVGMSGAEVKKLAKAEARAKKAFVLPGHILRFSDHHRTFREIVHSPEIGSILALTARRHRDESHATRYADIDPVLMTMIHDIDLALWIAGTTAAEVFAIRSPTGAQRSDTMMMATDTRGAAWHLSAAWTYPTLETPPDRIEVVGERGGVELEAGSHIRQFGAKTRRIDLRSEAPEDPLGTELGYFIDCIRTGTRPSVVTLGDAHAGLGVAEAVLKSLRKGRTARL